MEHGGTGDNSGGNELGIWQAVDIVYQSSYPEAYGHEGHERLYKVPGHGRKPGAP